MAVETNSAIGAPRAPAPRHGGGGARRRAGRSIPRGWAWLVAPGFIFLVGFFGLPLADMLHRSLTDPSPGNYAEVFETHLYLRAFGTTFRTAFVITLVTLVLGYPYAYAMNRSGRRLAILLGILIILPFWSSLLVRTYAWTVLLQDSGVINSVLQDLGVIHEPLSLIRTRLGVTIGMVHILLPFMVLSIYAGMRRIDRGLLTAAGSLGAPPFRAFRRVFLPLSLPGVYAGCLLVFVTALGFYITPALLGSPTDMMISELIVQEVSDRLDFGIVLLLITLVVLALGNRLVQLDRVLGYGSDE